MLPWTFYPAFLGTFISVIAWTYLARREHLAHMPRTLSELSWEKPEALRYYRVILWTCGPMFAIMSLFFIVPRIEHAVIVAIVSTFMVISEMAVGIFPAQRGKITIHDIIAAIMGFAMISCAFLFAWSLGGGYRYVELVFATIASVLGALTLADRPHYLFYELPFIYIGHFSVLAAALALR